MSEKDARTSDLVGELVAVLEQFAKALETGDFWNVSDSLNARMCCNGDMCGCRGSTVGEYLAYELRAVLAKAKDQQ